MNEAFQPLSNKGMNSPNSHFKLNYLLQRISEKTEIFNVFKRKKRLI